MLLVAFLCLSKILIRYIKALGGKPLAEVLGLVSNRM
jgi:hypothetical protein